MEQGVASKAIRRNDVGYFIRDARRSQQVVVQVQQLVPLLPALAVQCSNVEVYYLAVQDLKVSSSS